MSETAFTTSRGAFFLQKDGPNTKPEYLGCVDLDDIAEPQGAVNLIRCFRPDGQGWSTKATTQEPPDPVTVTVTDLIEEAASWLEKVRCPATLFINLSKCGRLDDFTIYDRTFAVNLARITNKGLSQLVRREEDLESLQSFEFAGDPPVLRMWQMTASRQPTLEANDLNDVAFCNDPTCADECGVAMDICEDGIAVADSAGGSPSVSANVLCTDDGGADNWGDCFANPHPFGGGEDIMSAVCFPISATETRWLVARAAFTTEPMEVAYSDDGGATWTAVTVGATNNQGANTGSALFAIDRYHIWLVLDLGYIYFSDDGGVTWTAQEEGTVTPNDLNAVWAADELNVMAVGATDTVLFSSDGGSTWSAAAATGGGNALNCVAWSFGFWWIGDASANLYYSNDNGAAWTGRTQFPNYGVGTINDIMFSNELCGFVAWESGANVGTLYRTRDGGYTWEAITTPTNSGLNALWVCGCNMVYAVGEAHTGTGFIVRAIGSIHA